MIPDSDESSQVPNNGASEVEEATTPPIVQLIDLILERIDPTVQLLNTWAERSLKLKQQEARFRIHLAWVAVAVVSVIVVTATVLTYLDKIEGSTYAFLLGLIVGYLLTFIRDAIGPVASDES